MQFLVTQIAKRKYAGAYHSVVAIFEADTAKKAIKLALESEKESGVDGFTVHPDFKRPTAEPLTVGKPYLV